MREEAISQERREQGDERGNKWGKREEEKYEKIARVRERKRERPASCERLQSFLILSSIPADSMSHPTLQQGQSHAISQAYSALLHPCSSSIQAHVVLGLHKVYFHCHAPSEEGLDNDAVNVTWLEEIHLPQGVRLSKKKIKRFKI